MQVGATLIVLAGRSGTGKSTLAHALARSLGALWLRVDSIEQAIKASGIECGDAGYRTAYAVADDNLRLGRTVIGDSVNPWMLTRDAWRDVGIRADARVVEVETVCSNRDEHRRRIETRAAEVPGLQMPTWDQVIGRDYHVWDRDHLTIDTCGSDLEACVQQLLKVL